MWGKSQRMVTAGAATDFDLDFKLQRLQFAI